VALGYTVADSELLAADVRCHAMGNDAVTTKASEDEWKHEVHGRIDGPVGKLAVLMAAWIALSSEDVARFAAALPRTRG